MYELTDKAIDLLNRKAIKRFDKAKSNASSMKFDELNVIKEVQTLYEDLEKDNEEVFLELAEMQYEETEPKGKEKPDREWLLLLLAAYNPVSKYIYSNEVYRKRDRAAEAINSTTAKATEFIRQLQYWSQQTKHYADVVTDEAVLKAYRDAGVKDVKLITADDDKVCKVCKERDGKIYPINKIPPKPHYGCRCWYEAVKNK